jgi:hypothetical protein
LCKRFLHVHYLNHSTHGLFKEFERGVTGPVETLVNQTGQIGDLHAGLDIHLADAVEVLFGDGKALQKDDESTTVNLGEYL